MLLISKDPTVSALEQFLTSGINQLDRILLSCHQGKFQTPFLKIHRSSPRRVSVSLEMFLLDCKKESATG